MNKRFFLLRVFIVCMIISGFFPYSVIAANSIERIIITSEDTSLFPQIQIITRILDNSNRPIDTISAQDIDVYEDGEAVSFELKKTYMGLSTVILFDLNENINIQGRSGEPVEDEMRAAALQFVNTMKDQDKVMFMAADRDAVHTLLDFTSDTDILKKFLTDYSFSRKYSYISFPLEGVNSALENLKNNTGRDSNKAVLLISSGITASRPTDRNRAVNNTTRFAADASIPIFTILTNPDSNPRYLDLLAENSAGMFVHYEGEGSPTSLYEEMDLLRKQYQISYRTKSVKAGERILSITRAKAKTPITSLSFSVKNPPQPPRIETLIINNGDPIIREATAWDSDLTTISPTEVRAVINYDWPDGYPRELRKAELLVNGQLQENKPSSLVGDIFFTINLRGIIDPGTTTIVVETHIEDELGLQDVLSQPVAIQIMVPEKPSELTALLAMPVCDALEKVPTIGEDLGGYCRTLGITPTAIINFTLWGVMLVLVGILWVNRTKVASGIQETGQALTSMYKRLTQQVGGREPKARLEALKGIEGGERTIFDLFGETPVGRDKEYAELVFVNQVSISREHCIFHEDRSTGNWTLEDRDSANGTYLNGNALEPFTRYPIKDGDIVELSQVERGGIKFRFYMLGEEDVSERPTIVHPGQTPYSENQLGRESGLGQNSYQVHNPSYPQKSNRRAAYPQEDSQVTPLNEGMEVAETQVVKRTSKAPHKIDEADFDPSQHTF